MKHKTGTAKIFTALLSALLMVFAMAEIAFAEDTPVIPDSAHYYNEDGEWVDIQRGPGEDQYKVIAVDWLPTETLTLEPGWYYSIGGGSITSRVEVKGDVKIILGNNGGELTFDGGLHVPEGSTLSIYGETKDYSQSGKLIAKGDYGTAGIGGNRSTNTDEQKTGTINIYGGAVEATGGDSGSGIGGGRGYIYESSKQSGGKEIGGDGGTLNIYTGEVTATGGAGGAGLGGGFKGDSGEINISGGTINATGAAGGSGIGGGCGGHINYNGLTGGNANNITITGGRIKAYGAGGGAGIGAGAHANGSKVWYENYYRQINWVKIGGSANVYAKGSDGGAGIGGAMDDLNDWYYEGGGCNVEIYGSARVEAIGGAHAAGIGAAKSKHQGAGECIIKDYATVTAQGGDYAAGIGCADKIVTLTQYTKYRRLYDIKISGHADVTATGGKEAAGIGCGDEGYYGKSKASWEAGNQGIVRITGEATVKAKGDKYGAGIGGGDQQVNGYVEIGGPVIETSYGINGAIYDRTNDDEEANNKHDPTVTATGGYGAAGIGCGDDTYDSAGCAKIEIKGGTVNATGGDYGAGIGGADGSVYNETVTITGGKITAKGVKEAAGIGGGNYWKSHGGGDGGPVKIDFDGKYYGKTDSYVLAVSDSDAAPIGHGDGGSKDGDLSIGSYLSVKKSSSRMEYDDISKETPSPASWRVKDCQNDGYKTVLVQYCAADTYKDALIYTMRDKSDEGYGWYHKVECPYCEYANDEEKHTPEDVIPDEPEHCEKCSGEKVTIQFYEGSTTGEVGQELNVTPYKEFKLPEPRPEMVPPGTVFDGWSKTTDGKDLMQPGDLHKPTGDEEWYAMYVQEVTIAFYANNGTEESWGTTAGAYSKYKMPGNMFGESEIGEFAGWNTKADGSGDAYKAKQEFTVPNITDPIKFYAQWNHEHVFDEGHHYKAVAATCESDGSREYWQCKICDGVFLDENGDAEVNKGDTVVPATGHLWGEAGYTWAADGKSVTAERVCLNDSKHVETETASLDNGKLSEEVKKEAKCDEEGETVYTASFTNEAFEKQTRTVTTDKIEHDWSEWKISEDDSSKDVRTCATCGKVEERATSHTHSLQHVAAEEPAGDAPVCLQSLCREYWKCTECGRWYADEQTNQEIEGETDKQKEDSWKTPAAGHRFGVEEVLDSGRVEATCTTPGNYNTQRTCTVCGAKERVKSYTVPALGHDWNAGVVTEEATCTENGTKTYTCLNDPEHTKTETIEAFGHDWGEWETTKEATETEQGQEQRVCSRDATHVETRTIPVKDHEHAFTHVKAIEPTCTEDGNIEYWICDGGDHPCGKYFKEVEEVDDEGKEYTEKIEISQSETVMKALGHDYIVVAGSAKEATCTEAGKKADQECTNCGDIITGEKTDDALGHDWGNWEVTREATATKEGVETRTCSRCGEKETRDIPISTAAGTSYVIGGSTYKILSAGTVSVTKAKNAKSVTVPAAVKIGGKTFKVTQIDANAFKGKSIRTVTIGKNVNKVKKNAFKGSKVTKLIVKTKKLKKKTVKGSLKGSKVKTAKVKVGKKAVNKKYVLKYKKIFTKKNAGKRISVK